MRPLRPNSLAVSLVLASVLAMPVAASAQSQPASQPGVHAAPGSPAGKEYAIPVDSARSIGGSTPHHTSTRASQPSGVRQVHQSSSPASGNSASPSMFGAGITPAASSPSTSAAAARRSARRRARHQHVARHHVVASKPAAKQAVAQTGSPVSSPAPATSSSNGVAWMIALGLGAIVVGSGAGLALRARR